MALVKQIKKDVGAVRQEVKYADFTNNLQSFFGSTDIALRVNEDAVTNSIRNLLLLNRGERFFAPELGSNIRALLFENITPVTTSSLKSYVIETIENFEPRARLLDVIVDASPDENAYSISVYFYTINKTEPTTLEVILNRIR
jgi:phage baseplate assembly protein W